MRQTVKVKHLPGADTIFAGGQLKNLAVACSSKHVSHTVRLGGCTHLEPTHRASLCMPRVLLEPTHRASLHA